MRNLAPLLLIAVVLATGYWLYAGSGRGELAPVPGPPSAGRHDDGVEAPPLRAGPAVASTDEPIGGPPPDEIRRRVELEASHRDAEQGIKGRVLLPNGEPARAVPVYLMANMIHDPIRVFLLSRGGDPVRPLAAGQTAADGTFALGALQAGKSHDLRVVSDGHPELVYQSVKVRSGDWFDTGDLQLLAGVRVAGRVIDAASKVGVPNASVFLTSGNRSHTLLPTPGRERGIAAITDGTGAFRFDNASAQGIVSLLAEAPGYAATNLANERLGPTGRADLVLELASGRPIAGIVVDTAGEPVANVQVTAQGLSQKTPQTATASTGTDGRFEFPSLREGPYRLVTENTGYAETSSRPVLTDELDVKLVLAARPWVKLKVVTASGRPIKAYRIGLKRHFPTSELGIGNVPDFRDRSITPADYPAEFDGEWAVVRGLPHGEFVFQIMEAQHAKTLSPPFVVRPDHETPQIEAKLTLGATITGTVIDEAGKPVRSAIVSTDMNNSLASAGGFLDFIKQMVPERHSRAQTRTDAQGRFRLPKLAFAAYMLRVSHPDYCVGTALDITLTEAGQVADVGVVQLARGTIIDGYTTIAGLAAGQIKVSVTTPQPAAGAPLRNPPPKSPPQTFAATAISDNDGRYRLLARVPPGEYKIHALRASGSSNPFEALLDIKATEKTITVGPGQDRMKIDFNLATR